MHTHRSLIVATIAAAFAILHARAADDSPVTPAQLEKMTRAMPAEPRMDPAQPRRVLIFTLCRGFKHGSIPYASAALKLLGERTGAYEATVTDDTAVFEPDSLRQFDAVIMNNTTGEISTEPGVDKLPEAEQAEARAREQRLKTSLLEFVRNGKGLVGVHAATDCCYKWEAYGELMGGYFWGHPWNEEVTVKLDDPGHPLCAAFKGQSYRVADEIYQFREPYSRDVLRVLLSLDTTKTNMNKGDKIRRTDDDFAVAWIRNYGKGRVFYCSLGHRNEIFWDRTLLQFYLDGIQFALGDFPADATPSAELGATYLEKSQRDGVRKGLDAIFAEMQVYDFAGDQGNTKRVADLAMRAQVPDSGVDRRDIAARLAGLLAAADSSKACKLFACKQLRLIGTAREVPALAALLADSELTDAARCALEDIPGDDADAALVAALADADGARRVGILNSLGVRRAESAVPALLPLLRNADRATVAAAARALAHIATDTAVDGLLEACRKAAPTTRADLEAALLHAADELVAQDASLFSRPEARAAEIYALLATSATAGHVRPGAVRGLLLTRPNEGVPLALDALRRPDRQLAQAVAGALPDIDDADATRAFADALPKLAPENQPLVIAGLAERGQVAALPAVLQATKHEMPDVRIAALRALAVLGDDSTAVHLARLAAAADDRGTEQTVARESLYRLNAPATSVAIQVALTEAEPPVRAELIRALGERKNSTAVPAVLSAARAADRDVRKAALEALAQLASPPDAADLVQLLLDTDSASDRTALGKIVVAVARDMPAEERPPRAVLAAVDGDISDETRCVLFDVLGKIGAAPGLPPLYDAVENGSKALETAAIRALAEWPNAEPMATLRHVGRTSDDLIHRVLALRGYAKQLAMPSDRPMKETVALYREALDLAQTAQEKKSLLSGLAHVCHPEALTLCEALLEDPEVRDEALLSATTVMQALEGAAMVLTASHGQGSERNAIDGTRDTRWTSGGRMQGGEWFEVDLGYETDVTEIRLDAGPVGSDWPRGYDVYVTRDRAAWGDPVLSGKGTEKIFTIRLPAGAYGRYVKIAQTGEAAHNYWSIAEMKINGNPSHAGDHAELDRGKWVVSASEKSENAPHAIDGDREKRWGTGRGQKPGDWFKIDLGEEHVVRRIVLDAARSTKDYPRGYEVYLSKDGETWQGPFAKGEGSTPKTSIPVLPRPGRFIKIVQTGDGDRWWWSVYDLHVFVD